MSKAIEPNRVYTTQEAAEILQVHKETITRLCKAGTIKARKLKEYKILGSSLIYFLSLEKEIEEVKKKLKELQENEKNRS